jgi:hypothetical protein
VSAIAGLLKSGSAPVLVTLAWPLAYVAARLYVGARDGFGAGDLPGFGIWTAVWLVPLLLTYLAAAPVLGRLSLVGRLLGAFLVGLGSGILFAVGLAAGMGPMVAAFSFPILHLWAGAGAVACVIASLFTVRLEVTPRRSRLVLRAGVAVLSFGIPVVLPTALAYGSMYVWDRGQDEVFLLPSGYEGAVMVFYNRAGAPALPTVDGKRVIEISPTGLLVTASPRIEGWSKREVFDVTTTGEHVPVQWDWTNRDSPEGERLAYSLSTRMSLLQYQALGVGPRRNREIYRRQAEAVLDSVALTVFRRNVPPN